MDANDVIGVYVFICVIIVQRIGELVIAKRNEQVMKKRGGIEVGEEHYFLFIVLHVSFFISLLIETYVREAGFATILAGLLWGLFLFTQLLRIWSIKSLGNYWNTKIIIIPHEERITTGPYKFLNHPNYLIVGVELFVIPLMVQAYYTALLFPLLHILLMFIRIPAENRALSRLR